MKAIGHVRVSTAKQADHWRFPRGPGGKIRAIVVVHSAEPIDFIVDGVSPPRA
jgi:hypothetical protein